ncbi:GAF domain-containing protein [Streptomyces humi]
MTEYPHPSDRAGTAGRVPSAASPDAVDERNRRLARAGVARAEKLLMTRYRVGSQGEAFDLLRRTSQRFNVKLHTLADVAVRLPAPAAGAADWVPNRPRGAPPPLPALHTGQARPGGHGAVLKTALRRTMHVAHTHMGHVQLVENGMLRMAQHAGLARQFTDYFAFVGDAGSPCARAAEDRRQITVKDVASSDTFDEASRQAVLRTGSRACHSVPLVGQRGGVMGVISTHHDGPVGDFSTAQLTALDHLGTQVGRWLLWHRHTVVLPALNHLHASAAHRD